ncbi:MAG: histidinol-phosphate transaminase [Cyclobacteriaceae bacterium]|jgi:histidinol-phosphate aminotransferase|nr:histidinol-phosphate transaminase [Cyclobacteriaceae bacterium]
MKKININALARENVKKLQPYSSARDDFQGTASLFLDANENPFESGFNRYPDPHQKKLKQVIGALRGVSADHLFLGNGSDEAIDLLIRTFCEPGRDAVLIPQPTYGMYAVSAATNDIAIHSVLLTPDFQLDTKGVLQAVTPSTRIIFLCSPNNPSGNLLRIQDIEHLLSEVNCLVVVDEAYIDFSDQASWSERLSEFENLIVLQTLSKAWGLAGLRIGICIAHPEVIALLNKIKPPYNINSFTQAEALRRLTERAIETREQVSLLRQERIQLSNSLKKLKSVRKVFPSDANFILVQIDHATEVYHKLVSKGTVVRDRSGVVGCADCLRFTIGTPAENSLLIDQLNNL